MTTINLCDSNEPFPMTGVTFKYYSMSNWDKNVFKLIPLNGYVIMLCCHMLPITNKVNCIMSHVFKWSLKVIKILVARNNWDLFIYRLSS